MGPVQQIETLKWKTNRGYLKIQKLSRWQNHFSEENNVIVSDFPKKYYIVQILCIQELNVFYLDVSCINPSENELDSADQRPQRDIHSSEEVAQFEKSLLSVVIWRWLQSFFMN